MKMYIRCAAIDDMVAKAKKIAELLDESPDSLTVYNQNGVYALCERFGSGSINPITEYVSRKEINVILDSTIEILRYFKQ